MIPIPINEKARPARRAYFKNDDQQFENSRFNIAAQEADLAPRSALLKPLGGNQFRLTTHSGRSLRSTQIAHIRSLMHPVARMLKQHVPVHFVLSTSEGFDLVPIESISLDYGQKLTWADLAWKATVNGQALRI